MREREERLALAGAGPVALALGRALRERGWEIVAVASRNAARAAEAAAFIGGGARVVPYGGLTEHSTRVVIAVSDAGIAAVAEELAGAAIVLHTCGAYGAAPLAGLRERGTAVGSLHPLQTFRDPLRAVADLRGAAFGLTGDAAAAAWGREIAAALEGRVLEIAEEARPLYHAAAVMASNAVAAAMDAAMELLGAAGIDEAAGRAALGPISRASLENALAMGPLAALTGPVVRGDAATVAGHRRAIAAAGSGAAGLYDAAARHALGMARRRGLDDERSGNVERVLDGR